MGGSVDYQFENILQAVPSFNTAYLLSPPQQSTSTLSDYYEATSPEYMLTHLNNEQLQEQLHPSYNLTVCARLENFHGTCDKSSTSSNATMLTSGFVPSDSASELYKTVWKRKPNFETSQTVYKRRSKVSGKRPHSYTEEQENFIASEVVTPEIWQLFFGLCKTDSYNKPKTNVREAIAKKFNERFSDENRSIEIDEAQLKNKLHSMMKSWKTANQLFSETECPYDPTLRKRVLSTCHFYYIWESSALRTFASQEPSKTIKGLRRCHMDDPDEGDETNHEEVYEAIESQSLESPQWQIPKLSKNTIQQSTRVKTMTSAVGATQIMDLKDSTGNLNGDSIKHSIFQQGLQREWMSIAWEKLEIERRKAKIEEKIKIAELEKIEAEAERSRIEAVKAHAELALILAKTEAIKNSNINTSH
ncbi:hypothetical protein BGZ49_004393 [Haplosporangium sp. Z 27]|nr:hypothetical protein BGZ49_004393 [Haplosporangium sp. Z 27]